MRSTNVGASARRGSFFCAGLHEMAIEAAFVPSEIRLAREVRRDAGAAAMNLAFLQRQVDLDAARIAAHLLEFDAEGFFQDVVHDRGQIRSSGGAAFGRFLGVHDVFDGFPRRLGSHVKQQVALIDAAQPSYFAHVERRFLASEQLVKIDAAARHAQRQAVRFRDAVNVIGRAQRTGAGHILNDDVWVSWNVLAHMAREDARILVVKTAGREADDDANRFVFVERRRIGRRQTRSAISAADERCRDSCRMPCRFFSLLFLTSALSWTPLIRQFPVRAQSRALTDSSPSL